jgi:hypothetical protein
MDTEKEKKFYDWTPELNSIIRRINWLQAALTSLAAEALGLGEELFSATRILDKIKLDILLVAENLDKNPDEFEIRFEKEKDGEEAMEISARDYLETVSTLLLTEDPWTFGGDVEKINKAVRRKRYLRLIKPKPEPK